ncbi:RNA polymerase sigma factor SigJ [Pacificispira sp.]|uniref:RNA polymerase sigma factor SigJ n=1 Tax=Pacificispira sp. TaxID=2888761 RepID=UPI003BA84860
MTERNTPTRFETVRPTLLGLAYRILGSRADAEDAVQDTYLKWNAADQAEIDNPAAWLTTVCTRQCLDHLRSAHRSRTDYVGAWLPEPMQTDSNQDPEGAVAIASSLTTAFLLMLERLTPKERAAYLLHEIFDVDYRDIAQALDLQETACRKLVSRAKSHVERARVRHVTSADNQRRLLSAFESALATGQTGALAALLTDDIVLSADGGGKVPTVAQPIYGKADVLAFIAEKLGDYWADYAKVESDINGGLGLVLTDGDAIVGTVGFAYDEKGRATDIFIMRNPDKLTRITRPTLQ